MGDSTRVEFYWFLNHADTLIYFLFTGRNQPGDCTYTVDYDGVAYDFGSVPPGASWTDVDLEGTGLYHALDSDGSGSYGKMAQSWDEGQGIVVLSPNAQPMLWSSYATSNRVSLAGTNHEFQLDDDNPTDGRHDPNIECYSYSYAVCPDSLQACVGFGNCRCERNECSGRERLKALMREKFGQCKVKLVLLRGLPNYTYLVKLPTGTCGSQTANNEGKAVLHEYPTTSGTALIPTCGVSVEVICP